MERERERESALRNPAVDKSFLPLLLVGLYNHFNFHGMSHVHYVMVGLNTLNFTLNFTLWLMHCTSSLQIYISCRSGYRSICFKLIEFHCAATITQPLFLRAKLCLQCSFKLEIYCCGGCMIVRYLSLPPSQSTSPSPHHATLQCAP